MKTDTALTAILLVMLMMWSGPIYSALTPAMGGLFPASNVAHKKLIHVSHELLLMPVVDVPGKVDKWQETGLDGLVFNLCLSKDVGKVTKENSMQWRWWALQPLKYEDFRADIEAIKSVGHWGRLTDNFIWTGAHVETLRPPNWFNDADWDIILSNTRLAASITKEVGFKGIFFDAELYGGGVSGAWDRPWDYPLYVKEGYKHGGEAKPRSFADVAAKVRQRGEEWGKALTSEYPDIVVFVIPSLYGFPWQRSLNRGQGLADCDYGLLPAFVDGLLIGLGERATLVSGCEATYFDSQYRDMLMARDLAKEQSMTISTSPELARQRISFSVGLWLDAGWRPDGRFSDVNVGINLRDPKRHEHAVHNALAASDHYAWLYGDSDSKLLSTPPTPLMREYWLANVKGHQPHDLTWEPEPVFDANDYSDADMEAAMVDAKFWEAKKNERYEVVTEMPKYWRFRFDPEMVSYGRHWETESTHDKSWLQIDSTRCWQSQGTRAHGTSVYRTTVDIPASIDPNSQDIFVAVGCCGAGSGIIFVNGVYIYHELDRSEGKGFQADVTSLIRPGKPNLIAFSFDNRTGPGGLMGHVKILVREKEHK